jgi:uncharacterized protein (DUF427 family)
MAQSLLPVPPVSCSGTFGGNYLAQSFARASPGDTELARACNICGGGGIERSKAMAIEAVWNETVVAHSDRTVVVEGNHYFPREDVDMSCLVRSATTTECPWKGTAHYYSVEVDGETSIDGAWYYPDPKVAAEDIRDRIAFWNGVEVSET